MTRALLTITLAGIGLSVGEETRADFLGATVTGYLAFPPSLTPNYFNPLFGYVPAGYGNSSSPTIVLSGGGLDNFAWLQGGGTISNPGIDSWYAEFSGSQLTVTFRNINYGGRLSGSRLWFKSDAFVGASIVRIGGDDFVSAGNGPMTESIDGDTITLEVAPQCLPACPWPADTYTNTYSLAPGPQLTTLTLSSAVVAGCKSVTGRVTLSEPALSGGATVTIADTLAAASTPAAVLVSEGATSKSFAIKTSLVEVTEPGDVSATLGGTTLSKPLTVRPVGISSVSLTPTSAIGGKTVMGKATLECKAGPGPITVDLSSNNAAVASPVAASIVVPQGLQSANFDVTTNAVQTKSYATIAGTANSVTKSKKLTVNVAAAVSPTSLKFGNVTVGATSAPQNATLTNKGAVPFSVNSISLTGTGASWFAQTNNCPANLAAGASCTISVTFTPLSAASKSAKLTIATTATSTPLSVSLSGTGL